MPRVSFLASSKERAIVSIEAVLDCGTIHATANLVAFLLQSRLVEAIVFMVIQTLDKSSAMIDLHGSFCSLIFPDFSRLSLDSQEIKSEGVGPVIVLARGDNTILAQRISKVIPCFTLCRNIILWNQVEFPKFLQSLLLCEVLHYLAPLML